MTPIQWTEWPTGAFIGAGSLWPGWGMKEEPRSGMTLPISLNLREKLMDIRCPPNILPIFFECLCLAGMENLGFRVLFLRMSVCS
jgi:hypothetical protein